MQNPALVFKNRVADAFGYLVDPPTGVHRAWVPVESRSHPWMRAYRAVLAHPYFAVTDREGAFQFATEGLADGTCLLRRWHPELGETEAMPRWKTVRGGPC